MTNQFQFNSISFVQFNTVDSGNCKHGNLVSREGGGVEEGEWNKIVMGGQIPEN